MKDLHRDIFASNFDLAEDIALEMHTPLHKPYVWIPDDQKLFVGSLSRNLYGADLTRWLSLHGFESPIKLKAVPE